MNNTRSRDQRLLYILCSLQARDVSNIDDLESPKHIVTNKYYHNCMIAIYIDTGNLIREETKKILP